MWQATHSKIFVIHKTAADWSWHQTSKSSHITNFDAPSPPISDYTWVFCTQKRMNTKGPRNQVDTQSLGPLVVRYVEATIL